jgi:predicted neuraminidase
MEIQREFVFGDDRPFASCHASTVVPLKNGGVAAAWFGGSYESHEDVAIWLSLRADSWGAPIKVADEEHLPHWNPVLAYAPDGILHLFYKVGPNAGDWRSRTKTSPDDGQTWGDARDLPLLDGFTVGPVKDKPIITKSGIWLAPTSKETTELWDAAVAISSDNGGTWRLSRSVPLDHSKTDGKGIIQPTLWESEPRKIHMLLRSTTGSIYRSDSADNGETWCEAYPISLPNNNSGIDLDRVPDGRLALCYNPVDMSWGKRTPLALSFSSNQGQTWNETHILEDEDPEIDEERVKLDRAHRPNEFSYPAVVADGNRLLITYTWKRERICLRMVELG